MSLSLVTTFDQAKLISHLVCVNAVVQLTLTIANGV